MGVDAYRIIAVLAIYLFHSNVHIQCSYGVLTPFINMGAIYMTAFFILSGFSLYISWHKQNFYSIDVIKKFYIKRFIGIMPLYYVVALLFVLVMGNESTAQNLLLAPIEILGIQASFDTLFNVSHNGGTWFVSCIIMCYLVYPLIQEIVKQISTKIKIIIMAIASLILLYSPFIVAFFNTSGTYPKPFFRIMEFIIGAIACSLIPEIKNSNYAKFVFSWQALVAEYIILFCGVTLAIRRK
ncbi:acyltransferase family protein [Butyrivibrio sp. INlla14]|uniref:acyltransferase family protein n=1 Tax=Butyrivibrio sp. INlla14 TaxID=1520808 RepID=UPI000876F7BC|nr:acyltransferase family protein [Butyrivibrio sp. INlla14]SCX84317.1 Acyltransferase family protein [Butyrivibrio sp. INlla14]